MVAIPIMNAATFSGDQFAVAAKQLFGNITQRFFASPHPPNQSLSYCQMGASAMSRIVAPPHAVIGIWASPRSVSVDSIKVLVQIKGMSHYRQGGDKIGLTPNSAVIYDPAQPYAMVNVTDVEQVVLQIPRRLLTDAALRRLAHPHPVLPTQDGAPPALASFFKAAGDTAASLNPDLRANIGEMLVNFTQSLLLDNPHPQALLATPDSLAILRDRIKAYVAERAGDIDLSLATMAKRMGCSVRYLHRAFETEGMTVQKFVWNVRLDKSHAMLQSAKARPHSITDIAISCGFSSSSHFSRLFRQRFGMTPNDARSQAATSLRQSVPYR